LPPLFGALTRLVNYLQTVPGEIPAEDRILIIGIQDVLYHIYYEEGSCTGSTHGLFAGVVYACLCVRSQVDRFRSPAHAGQPPSKSPRVAAYGTATTAGTLLTGIMYSVSCVGMLQTYVYNGEEPQEVVYKRVKSFLEPQTPVGFQLLVQLRSLATTLRPFEAAITEFTPCSNASHGLCGTTNQIELSTAEIGSKVKELQKRISHIMFTRLLLQKKLPARFRARIDRMVDRLDNMDVGYSPLSEPENETFNKACINWFTDIQSENPNFFSSPTWVAHAQRLLKVLCAAIHLSSGSPGRGTELEAYKLVNTAEARRTVYFRKGEVMLLPHYEKRRSLMGAETPLISRFVDAETAYLFKAFLLLIHPWLQFTLLKSSDPALKASIEGHLVTGSIDPGKMGQVLTGVFQDVGMKMNFNNYRHHQTGLLKEKCRRENLDHAYLTLFGSTDTGELETEDEDSFEELTPLQQARFTTAGHGIRTAIEKYAVRSKAYGDKSRTISLQKNSGTLDLHRRVAREWHVHLGLRKPEPLLLPSADPSERRRPAHAGHSSSPAHAGPAHAGHSFSPAHACQSSGRHCSPCLHCSPHQLFPMTPPTSRTFFSPQLPTPVPNSSTPPVSRNILPELLSQSPVVSALDKTFSTSKGLSKLYGPLATWKSVEQERAMKMVADNKDDLLVILRTGGGKSAVVAGPILFETGFTVWIAPLRALQSETNRWMSRFGINVYSVDDADLDRAGETGNVILISPSDVQKDVYQNLLVRLMDRRLLNRVVIDEAHLALTAKRYRQEMRSLGAASNWGKACRTVLLSATVPPSLEKQVMLAACGADLHPIVIRGDPRRPNLQITVNNFKAEKNLPILVTAVARRSVRDYPTERSIIYCLTVEVLESLFKKLSEDESLSVGCTILKYHGQMDAPSSASSLRAWNSPVGHTIMIATEAFGCGIDVPDVRQVTLYGGAPSVLDFWQQAGRAGRDGRPAKVSVLFCPKVIEKIPPARGTDSFLLASCGIFAEYVNKGVSECRRIRIEACVGGRDPNLPVICGRESLPCNYCSSPAHAGQLAGEPSSVAAPQQPPSASVFPGSLPTPHDFRKAEHSRRVQSGDRESWEVGMHYLKVTSLFLRDLCPYCLLNHSTSASFANATDFDLKVFLRKASDCSQKCHVNYRNRHIPHCYRCMQTDHKLAAKCTNFRRSFSVDRKSVDPGFICGGCHCNTLDGRLLHTGKASGRNCPYEPAAVFCFVAYSVRSGRMRIENESSPYMQSVSAGYLEGQKDNAGRYLSWLTDDGRENDPAGLLLMLQYLFRVCDLDKLKALEAL